MCDISVNIVYIMQRNILVKLHGITKYSFITGTYKLKQKQKQKNNYTHQQK